MMPIVNRFAPQPIQRFPQGMPERGTAMPAQGIPETYPAMNPGMMGGAQPIQANPMPAQPNPAQLGGAPVQGTMLPMQPQMPVNNFAQHVAAPAMASYEAMHNPQLLSMLRRPTNFQY